MTASPIDWTCPVCSRHAQAGVSEGSLHRLFCFVCDVSWHVEDEDEPDLGPLAVIGDRVAIEPRPRRPSGDRC